MPYFGSARDFHGGGKEIGQSHFQSPLIRMGCKVYPVEAEVIRMQLGVESNLTAINPLSVSQLVARDRTP